MKNKYYSLKNILKKDALYNVIFGERSNGKTYAVLDYALERYFKYGERLAIIRRFEEDFIGANSARTCFESLVCNADGKNRVEELSGGKYNGIEYYGGKYYLTVKDEDEKSVKTKEYVANAFALTSAEHYKSASFPTIHTILFDEFITRRSYLADEFVEFCSILSTIIRDRNDVKVFMCGNTVNKYACPYFHEMGLYKVKDMRQGEIDIYNYTNTGLTVAVEYSDGRPEGKPSDVYFAFDNPRLNMVTTGSWELGMYPHLPHKYKPQDVRFVYFIQYEGVTVQCEVIKVDGLTFTYIHRKTTELRDTDKDLIYTTEYSARPNYRRKLTAPASEAEKRLLWFYQHDKVFYQDNELGELIRNYFNWCKTK